MMLNMVQDLSALVVGSGAGLSRGVKVYVLEMSAAAVVRLGDHTHDVQRPRRADYHDSASVYGRRIVTGRRWIEGSRFPFGCEII